VVGDCRHACDVSLEEFEDLQVYWLYFFWGGVCCIPDRGSLRALLIWDARAQVYERCWEEWTMTLGMEIGVCVLFLLFV
jgi:hypothetical protein